MKISSLQKTVLVIAAMSLFTGFGLGDLGNKLPGGMKDCSKSSDPKKCRKEEQLKTAGKVVAMGLAAKAVANMIIKYRASLVTSEDKVIAAYIKTHKTLPPEPMLVSYNSSIKPGQVVKAQSPITVTSKLVVVPGAKKRKVDIKESITIFDSKNHKSKLKSMVKPVNTKTKRSGAYQDQFSFSFPKGMPQGIYPIKTLVMINGKASKPTNNKMQLVLNVDQSHNYTLVALNQ